jgi:hypothetical protein
MKTRARSAIRTFGVLGVILAISVASGCEGSTLDVLQSTPVATRRVVVGNHAQRAAAALSAGDFASCAAEFASAAQDAQTNDRAHYLFEASRCSARLGDFRASLFQLSAAASAGYDNLADLQSDPLLRPLQGNARWQLVVDTVAENERSRPTPRSGTAVCSLIERLTSASAQWHLSVDAELVEVQTY